jgi:hypothetical protein
VELLLYVRMSHIMWEGGMDKAALKYVGREFSETEMELVREIVRMYPGLSRSELAAAICENTVGNICGYGKVSRDMLRSSELDLYRGNGGTGTNGPVETVPGKY